MADESKYLDYSGLTRLVTKMNAAYAAKSHDHTVSNITDLTATATELNYMDGVTSNVQTQLNGKAATGHTHSDYVNQNAFSNVAVGSTTVAADTATDTLTLVGSNVTLTPDATNDKVTIGITKDNVTAALGYTPPTTNTVTTVSTTGSGNAITALSASNGAITATKDATFLTAHPTITTSDDTTSTASATHGGTITMVDSVTRDGNGHVTKVNTKTVTLLTDNNTDTKVTQNASTANSALPLLLAYQAEPASGTASTANYAAGVTLNPSTGTIKATNFTGSLTGNADTATTASSCSGNAATATALTSSAGNATQPVYFSNGKPVACTYTLGKSVPSNAVFTDTVYTLPVAGTALGGIKSGTDITVDSSGNVSVNNDSHTHTKDTITSVNASAITGTIAAANLPSYVDDVLEYSGKANFPSTGETGKIYVDTATNLTYRWSGSAYVEISQSLALGETSSTAYRGDRGATAYTHATSDTGKALTSGLYKITTSSRGHVTAGTAVTNADITAMVVSITDSEIDSLFNQA